MKICIALSCALAFAACGSDDDDGSAGADAGLSPRDSGPLPFDATPETPTAVSYTHLTLPTIYSV